MTSTSVGAEFPDVVRTPPAPPPVSPFRQVLLPFSFFGPALLLLSVFLIYPAIATVIRALFDDRGKKFVWLDNFDRMFSDDIIYTAIKNNVIWIAIAPLTVTLLGLVLAVLNERISWASAFKVVLFLPLAISLFAVGVIWRIVYQQDPDQGLLNAGITVAHDVFTPPGVLHNALPSGNALSNRFVLKQPIAAGDTAKLALTGILPEDVPSGAKQAVDPKPESGKITGVVWRDFKPGGGKIGVVEKGELGIPGASIDLLKDGKKVGSAKTDDGGGFTFDGVSGSGYTMQIAPATFRAPFGGVEWLGASLVVPAIIIAFLWTAVGFAMVVIGAGLAAISRDVLEAARTDGASEFQIFRRVTVPLLMPVLTVVFVTQMIGVLKVFDIIYAIAPGSVRNDATTLAFEMWRRSFSGQNQFGFGAAIASFLMLLFLPYLIYQVRSQRKNA
ncbi:MAG TPA: sugar ABC transporter permease [Gaiellaceae bacterium]|jgi:alpha-glucoside transport system permease protein